MAVAPSSKQKKEPDMTPEQLADLIQKSPKHKHIVILRNTMTGLGGVGCLLALVMIGTSCYLGVEVVRAHKWLVFHYVVVGVAMLAHVLCCLDFARDTELLELPAQLQIDIGRLQITEAVAIMFSFYLFYKLKSVADAENFMASCSSTCSTKLNWMRISPLVTALLLVIAWIVQLWICISLYFNPVLHPPPGFMDDLASHPASSKEKGSADSASDMCDSASDMDDEEKRIGDRPLLSAATSRPAGDRTRPASVEKELGRARRREGGREAKRNHLRSKRRV